MRSLRAELMRALARAALAAACALGAAAGARAQDAVAAPVAASAPDDGASAAAPSADPRAARIETAVNRLREDPLLSGRHMEHRLRWKDSSEPDPKKDDAVPAWVAWLASLARFLNDTSRFLLWGGVAVLVALALVSARHLVQLRAFRRRA